MTNDTENTAGPGHAGGAETNSAAQGSQPTIAGLRIGIVDAATRGDVSKARLLLRPPEGDRAVTVTVGETVEVPGFAVTLDAVEGAAELPEPGKGAGSGAGEGEHSGTAGRGSAERARVTITVVPVS